MTAPGARQEFAASWPVVLAGAMGMALASLTAYSVGIFIEPLEQEFGWSRAEISGAVSMASVISVVSAPFVGMVIDRVGPRRIGVIGVFAYCLCFALLSFTTASVWSWWGLWLLVATAAALIKPTVWTAGVSSVFSAGRGLALSLMLCGTALGSTLTPIVGNLLIERLGWRMALVGLGAFWALLVIPIVFLFFSSARDRHRVRNVSAQAAQPAVLTGVGVREGLLSWKFVRLAGAGFLACIVVVSFVSNLVPILSSQAIPRYQAANLAGLIGISTIVGRLTGGFLLDRINGNWVGGFSLLLPIIPCALLLEFPGSVPVAAVAALVLGLSMGAELDAVAYLSARHFGMRNFGVLFGTVSGLLALATGLGPLLVSMTYDAFKSYDPVLMGYVPLCLLTAALFFSLGKYPVFDEPASPVKEP